MTLNEPFVIKNAVNTPLLGVSSTSSRVALSTADGSGGTSLMVSNKGTGWGYFKLGDSSVVADNTGIPVPPGQTIYTVSISGKATHAAAIGNGDFDFTRGSGR